MNKSLNNFLFLFISIFVCSILFLNARVAFSKTPDVTIFLYGYKTEEPGGVQVFNDLLCVYQNTSGKGHAMIFYRKDRETKEAYFKSEATTSPEQFHQFFLKADEANLPANILQLQNEIDAPLKDSQWGPGTSYSLIQHLRNRAQKGVFTLVGVPTEVVNLYQIMQDTRYDKTKRQELGAFLKNVSNKIQQGDFVGRLVNLYYATVQSKANDEASIATAEGVSMWNFLTLAIVCLIFLLLLFLFIFKAPPALVKNAESIRKRTEEAVKDFVVTIKNEIINNLEDSQEMIIEERNEMRRDLSNMRNTINKMNERLSEPPRETQFTFMVHREQFQRFMDKISGSIASRSHNAPEHDLERETEYFIAKCATFEDGLFNRFGDSAGGPAHEILRLASRWKTKLEEQGKGGSSLWNVLEGFDQKFSSACLQKPDVISKEDISDYTEYVDSSSEQNILESYLHSQQQIRQEEFLKSLNPEWGYEQYVRNRCFEHVNSFVNNLRQQLDAIASKVSAEDIEKKVRWLVEEIDSQSQKNQRFKEIQWDSELTKIIKIAGLEEDRPEAGKLTHPNIHRYPQDFRGDHEGEAVIEEVLERGLKRKADGKMLKKPLVIPGPKKDESIVQSQNERGR